jgi:hypothetical protein
MANPVVSDILAFTPHAGGLGVRVSCTTVASAAVGIPGANGENDRAVLTNGGSVSAFVRIGGSADLNSMEVLPGTQVVVGIPYSGVSGVTISAITASGTTTLSAVAGRGI